MKDVVQDCNRDISSYSNPMEEQKFKIEFAWMLPAPQGGQ